jgi:hypothetical protein
VFWMSVLYHVALSLIIQASCEKLSQTQPLAWRDLRCGTTVQVSNASPIHKEAIPAESPADTSQRLQVPQMFTLPHPLPINWMPSTMPSPVPVVLPSPAVLMPAPMPIGVSTDQLVLTVASDSANVQPQHYRWLKHQGRGWIEWRSHDVRSRCKSLDAELAQAGRIQLTAGKKCLLVCGETWKANADQITIHPNGQIRLIGQARLSGTCLGQGTTVRAQELTVQFRDGLIQLVIPSAK